jgi:hypothetical protein
MRHLFDRDWIAADFAQNAFMNALRQELQKMRAELDGMKAQFKKNDLLTRVEALETNSGKGDPQ